MITVTDVPQLDPAVFFDLLDSAHDLRIEIQEADCQAFSVRPKLSREQIYALDVIVNGCLRAQDDRVALQRTRPGPIDSLSSMNA